MPPAMGGSRRPHSCRASVRGLTTSLSTWGTSASTSSALAAKRAQETASSTREAWPSSASSWQARAPGTRSAMQGPVLWTASSSSSSAQGMQLGTQGFRLRWTRGLGTRHRRRPVEVRGRCAWLLGARGVQPLGFALGRRIAGKGASANGAAENDWPASLPTEGQRGLRTAGRDRLQPRNERGSRTVCAARLGR